MLPAVFVFLFLDDYLHPLLEEGKELQGGLIYYSMLGLVFMLLMFLFARWQYQSTYTTVYDESANRRISLAEKLRRLPLSFFGAKNLSDLTLTIMDDSTDLEHTFSHAVPQLFASVISLLLIICALFFYNWQLSLALLWVVPAAAAVILLAKKFLHKENKKHYLQKRDVSEHIQEGIDSFQEIKAYNKQEEFLAQFDAKLNIYENGLTRGELLAGSLVNSAQGLLKLGLATVIITGAVLLAAGQLSLFVFLLFLVVASRIYEPMNEVFSNLAALFYLDIRINRMKEMQTMPTQTGGKDFEPKGFGLEFREVCFSYEEGRDVLNSVSFTARQGEVTALVGPSGSGKSTLTRLAARFWDVDSGKVLLGGQDISKIDPELLLQNYSVVFQDVVLFNASVMDNIRIGKKDATDDEVLKVAQLAQCESFVNKLPAGYDTMIGENGLKLSGGERQRLSIARALLKDAPIVLLDEATASLDVENESKIQAALSELIRNKTVLIIAHRMRTVVNADKIVALEQGCVVECGSPDVLIAQNGLFAHMLQRQLSVCYK